MDVKLLSRNSFSPPVGTRSVGYLTRLQEPTFNEAPLKRSLKDINHYQKDNGAALLDGVKIAILLNKSKGALQQHLRLRAGQITNDNEIRASWISTFMSMLTGQDALLPGNQLQVSKTATAESEIYAICTEVIEGLHFLLETNICSELNLRIRTVGEGIATRQGAKRIDLKSVGIRV